MEHSHHGQGRKERRLIAAAPELLAALQKLLAPYPEQCECAPGFKADGAEFPPLVCGYCDARAAITKATLSAPAAAGGAAPAH